ncbi:transcriptional repressor LexA [Anoxynatronum buryatiense]|uniref:DNA 3'-5' helicase n=1 Tax=Anoxynatronum buryatiense TaxID=489973 RepID=A0AA46AKL4_9CLOT|nr:transcriptional repressor LexA [Anoxynatronum buryatiense]SMP70895.1 SOS regulatory protein LexA [Anoxynatronum buryatiense]
MQLNLEQKKLIQLEPSGHCLVKGVAGSGKTTVAIHRVPFLMNQYCHEKDDKILLVTFNKTLLNYIKYLYEKVENPDEQVGMAEMMAEEVKVDIRTIDSLVFTYYRKAKPGADVKIASTSDSYRIMSKAIHLMAEKEKTHKIINQKNVQFLIDEVGWMDACLIETLEEYQQVDRIGRATNVMEKTPQKLLKNSEVRAAVFKVKEAYESLLAQESFSDFRMMNKVALTVPIRESEQYTHIIIDESQDLTRAQLEMVKRLYKTKKYSSLMFIADNAQSIYPHSWLGKGRSYTTLGLDMSGKSRSLAKNYRTTTQISEAAYSLLEKDVNLQLDTDYVKPSLVDRKGSYPIYRHFATMEEELEHVKSSIQSLLGEYRLNEICIIAKEKRAAEEAQQFLVKYQVPCAYLDKNDPSFDSDKVKVTTMHSIKGLEFRVVFIICLNDGVIPYTSGALEEDNSLMESDDRRLLYVGMTRANEILYLSSHKKPSSFIREIDVNCLRFRRDCCLKPLYRVAVTAFLKKDKILDLYAKEEVIRQWVLKELIDSYGYKEEMIVLEYPVVAFSQKGYADLVVSIYHQGRQVPYVLVETKKYQAGIADAVKQAASYMQALATVRYCLVTDGYDLKIFDRDMDELDDLPRFNYSMLPDTIERYRFKSYRNHPDMLYERDSNEPGVITLKSIDSGLTLDVEEVTEVPVFGDVAAGLPKDVNAAMKDSFTLPRKWIAHSKNTFLLEVAGDSMKDAGIDVGDFVMVNHQEYADNGQIVVALLDEEATLKKYLQMGDSVLLIPENAKYEPINVKPDQVRINGVVIGVLKKVSR